MGISKLKKGDENKDAMHQQIKAFISKSNETSELIEKGSMIISYAIKSIDKDKLTDNDLDNLIEINAELVELRADIDENLNEMEKNMPSGSLFSTDSNRSQLESLLAAMTSILDKVINMKSQLTDIENRLKGQDDETKFRRIAIILRLRNNITSYSISVMQFNNMLMQAAH